MRNLIHTLLFLSLVGLSYGQTNKSLIESGDREMEMENYASAVYFYSRVINKLAGKDQVYHPYGVAAFYKSDDKGGPKSFNPPEKPKSDQLEVLHKISDAYRLVKDYENAEEWYAVAVDNPSEFHPYADYFYGYSLMKNGKYQEAKVAFSAMLEKVAPDNLYYQLSGAKIDNCDFALEGTGEYTNASIETLDSSINNGTASFGMMYHQNKLLFSSARIDSTVPDDYKHTSEYNSDVYFTRFKKDGTYEAPRWFEGNVNSEAIEGGAALSPNGKSMFFTRVNILNHNETSIYVSRFFNGRWTEPFKLGDDINVDGFKSMTPTMAEDGLTLYYSSNRPGTIGGMDIWKTTINEDGETTPPVNLGENVNTAEDEISPFYHSKSKTLYFSSEGHVGFGGFDVFKATINPFTDWWGAPINVGQPINSSRDDTYFVWGKDMQNGYLTSDRANCDGCDSLSTLNAHCNEIFRIQRPEIKILISGHVYDNDTDVPLPHATIKMKDVRGNLDDITLQADKNGYYEMELFVNEEYFFKAIKPEYFADATIKTTLGIVESTNLKYDFFLNKIPTGEVEIKGIEYDFDAATLLKSSEKELDKLVEFLELNVGLKIEIRSHTDERGDGDYNLDLSKRRAQSVVDYLVDNGISRSRLRSKGLGETEPVTIQLPSGKDVKLTQRYIRSVNDEELREKYHKMNRRTIFKIITD